MNHEDRIAKNGVLGMSEMLTNSARQPEQHAKAESVQASVQHLMGIPNDARDFSKIESGQQTLADELNNGSGCGQRTVLERTVSSSIGVTAAVQEAPLINMAHFEQFRELDDDGGMGLAREVIGIFLDNSVRAVGQVTSALTQDDVLALGKAAHSLKSSSANVGAQRLSGYYQQLEKLCRAQDLPAARAIVADVLREHELVVQKLKEVKVQLV